MSFSNNVRNAKDLAQAPDIMFCFKKHCFCCVRDLLSHLLQAFLAICFGACSELYKADSSVKMVALSVILNISTWYAITSRAGCLKTIRSCDAFELITILCILFAPWN